MIRQSTALGVRVLFATASGLLIVGWLLRTAAAGTGGCA